MMAPKYQQAWTELGMWFFVCVFFFFFFFFFFKAYDEM